MVSQADDFAFAAGIFGTVLVAFTTVVRGAPVEGSGELVVVDWQTKSVVAKAPISPTGITHDLNPNGNTRGGRGLELHDGQLIVGSFNRLHLFDLELKQVGEISHPLLLGVHEMHSPTAGQLWVAATRIDAALRFDLGSGKLVESLWPREIVELQEKRALEPLEIDKGATDQSRFADSSYADHGSHVHLNAVTAVDDAVYALFNRFGAVVELRSGRVVISDPDRLRGAHNIQSHAPGELTINDTIGRAVRTFDIATGKMIGERSLMSDSWARSTARRQDWRFKRDKALRKFGLSADTRRALFVRGLEPLDGSVLVGVSPGALLQVDDRGTVIDRFHYSDDMSVCIHGIRVLGD